jgi:Asp-tRNA(Asn)/Glu-tRNA(Gln) amidotransferase A subunit family amidase
LKDLYLLSATQAAAAIRNGECTSEELVQSCITRIQSIEERVMAWAFFDPEHALQQAREADQYRQTGASLGPLHGVPVGIKDIFDTEDMPTEYGTPIHAGHTPGHDASVVAQLRQAGAIIMGKTVTAELAVLSPGKTTNPHDSSHTPGGSSSGSAAAVAAGMVPLAIGTQTNGSIIRPASYCGVFGFKPSHGLISRDRVLKESQVLDQVGVFARSVEDVALMAEQMMDYDSRDPDLKPRACPSLFKTVNTEPPIAPRLAFIKTAVWDKADTDIYDAFEELAETLGGQVQEITLGDSFKAAIDYHQTIMEADLAINFESHYQRGKEQISPQLRQMIERGLEIKAVDYNRAVAMISTLRDGLDEIFAEYDAVFTPATTGEAPLGLDSTGSPVFCTLWTLLGLPAISLPLLEGSHGLPIGVQLASSKGDDARLLRTSQWLLKEVLDADV